MIEVDKYEVGHLKTNCYIIKDKDTSRIAIIDPGYKSKKIESIVEQHKDEIEYILLTHGHFDHIFEANKYRKITNAKILIGSEEDEFTKNNKLNLSSVYFRRKQDLFSADILLKDGETIKLGNTEIKAMHTPGHTKGGLCYVIDNLIFSGDTLMKETIGRTDFVTGSFEEMKKSLKKISLLKGEFIIYPGHGRETTLSYEKSTNIYLRDLDYDNLY